MMPWMPPVYTFLRQPEYHQQSTSLHTNIKLISLYSICRHISDQVKASDTGKTTFTLLTIPKLGSLCTTALQDAGVFAALHVESFPLELVPLERDVLSMEDPTAFKSIYMV